MSVLQEIVANTREEVAQRRTATPRAALERRCADATPALDFEGALRPSPGAVRLIAEVKKASPSRGVLAEDLDPATLAATYAAHAPVDPAGAPGGQRGRFLRGRRGPSSRDRRRPRRPGGRGLGPRLRRPREDPRVEAPAMTRVKICGITNLDDAMLAVDAGADAVGFIFVENTPRFVTPEKVAPIVRALP